MTTAQLPVVEQGGAVAVPDKILATKIRILTDVRIVCDPPGYLGRYCCTQEQRAKELESWCREFNDFIRDHRSQDPVILSVERIEPECCSSCRAEWEIFTDADGAFCASCGTKVSI